MDAPKNSTELESVAAVSAITISRIFSPSEYAPALPARMMLRTPNRVNSSYAYMPMDGMPIPLAITDTGVPK